MAYDKVKSTYQPIMVKKTVSLFIQNTRIRKIEQIFYYHNFKYFY